MWEEFNAWVVAQGAPALPDLEFIGEGDLNLYVYPSALDYTGARPLGPTWHRLESSVRETDGSYSLPPGFAEDGQKVIYFSLGSLGSADVSLMRRVIEALGRTPHRYIVSMGPLHDELELAGNMIGAEFLPQTKILPLVDLVITHGGNNTTTEAMHFGKPMIVLPLFWDQYDNAQRVAERGYGVRLDTYAFSDADLSEAIDHLLGDQALRSRIGADSAAIRASDGLRVAADAVEKLA
jgi:MGT family glycosyltransferase